MESRKSTALTGIRPEHEYKARFDCDYLKGACPEIMENLLATNMVTTTGYGFDEYSVAAKRKIKECCGLEEEASDVHFLIGGTQTNATVISALLKSFEGVMAVESAHINVHESGAIEATGHKVITLPAHNGKMDARELRRYLRDFYADPTFEHMVHPGMVYVSQSTEIGSLYSLAELEAISEVCREYGMPLYLDGARLAYALATPGNDLTLKDIARLCDVFYIGGTKCGALFGEAVVVSDKRLLPKFFPIIKLHGALLAKGRLLGLQFLTLFSDDLYLRLGRRGR